LRPGGARGEQDQRLIRLKRSARRCSGTETVVYGYDAAWRQQSVCISSGGCYAQAGTFDALNQPTSLTLGNTLRHTHPISAA
jgi:hypothetical protein